MKEIIKLEAYNIEQLVNLSGVKDENLEVLEDHFQVEISLRGDEMSIVGDQQQIEKTKKVIYSLLKLIVSGVVNGNKTTSIPITTIPIPIIKTLLLEIMP